jgi:hypothetical protein
MHILQGEGLDIQVSDNLSPSLSLCHFSPFPPFSPHAAPFLVMYELYTSLSIPVHIVEPLSEEKRPAPPPSCQGRVLVNRPNIGVEMKIAIY